MSIKLYMDAHVNSAITQQLEVRGVNVITAQDDARADRADDELLARATELGRVIFTHDRDFLGIAAKWQKQSRAFGGIVYAHPLRVSTGKCVVDLDLIAKCYEPVDMVNRVEHLPL